MHTMTPSEVENYLRRYGVTEPKKIQEIVESFDFTKAVYEQPLYPDDTLVCVRRIPSLRGGFWLPEMGKQLA